MSATKYISSIKQENEKYLLKDTEARTDIDSLEDSHLDIITNDSDEELIIATGMVDTQNLTYDIVNIVVKNYLNESDYTNKPYTQEGSLPGVSTYSSISCDYRKDEANSAIVNKTGTQIILKDNVYNRTLSKVLSSSSYSLNNFIPGTNTGGYIILDGDKVVAKGNVSTTTQHPIRMINVPSVYNVRDHGGWNCDGGYVKYGMIYRGGDFNNVSSSDKDILTKFLGIGCEIDFMFAYQGGQLTESPLGSQVEYVCLPTNASYENLVIPGLYKDGVYITNDTATDIMKPMLEKIFYNVAHNIPTYYHCSLGADRTGTLGFIIDSLLGISQSDVDKEWELTSFAEAEKGSSPRERYSTIAYWRYPDLVYYFVGGEASRMYRDSTANTYKENHTSATYAGFGHNNLRDNVAQWAVDELGISLSDINQFRRDMIVGNPTDIIL